MLTTKDLIDMIRQEAAICFDLRDAAAAEAKVCGNLVTLLGNESSNTEALNAAAAELKAARDRLVAAWDRLIEFEKNKRIT